MPGSREMHEKENRLRKVMATEGLSAIAISTIGNFAWLTCGCNNYVGIASEVGPTSAIITQEDKYIVCDNIEANRIMEEEVAGLGYKLRTCSWYETKRITS